MEDFKKKFARVFKKSLNCSHGRNATRFDAAAPLSFMGPGRSVAARRVDRFDSFSEAKMEWFDYIEVFHNQRRRR